MCVFGVEEGGEGNITNFLLSYLSDSSRQTFTVGGLHD